MSSPESTANAVAADASASSAQRITHSVYKLGTIGQLDMSRFSQIVDLVRDAFPNTPDERWVHRYREDISAYGRDEKRIKNAPRRVTVDRVVEAPTWRNMRAWLEHNKSSDLIHHLELHLTDGTRTFRLELGSSRGIEHVSSHKVRIETSEPEDDPQLARIATRAFHEEHERAEKKLVRATFIWLLLPFTLAYSIALIVDNTARSSMPLEQQQNIFSTVGLVGIIGGLFTLTYAYVRIRRRAASCLIPDWSTPGTQPALKTRMRGSLRSFWHTLGKHSVPLNTLVAIVMAMLTVLGLIATILLAN